MEEHGDSCLCDGCYDRMMEKHNGSCVCDDCKLDGLQDAADNALLSNEEGALWCDHCGDVAYTMTDDTVDGDGEKCQSCGHPGHVSCDSESAAYWQMHDGDDGFCERPDCEECNERKAEACKK